MIIPCSHGEADCAHAPGLEQEDMSAPVPQVPPQHRGEEGIGCSSGNSCQIEESNQY